MAVPFGNLRKSFNEGIEQDQVARQAFKQVVSIDSINAVVAEIYCPPKVRCGGEWTYVIFDDLSKRSLHVIRGLDSVMIDELLRPGYRILKPVGSDTIIVCPGKTCTLRWRFIISNNGKP
jgi:hypothetical protein